MRNALLPLVFTIVVFALRQGVCEEASLRVSNFDREINLVSQIAIISDKFKVQNDGSTLADEVMVCTSAAHKQQESLLMAFQDDSSTPPLKVKAIQPLLGQPSNVSCSALQLRKPLKKGDSSELEVYGYYTHMMTPKPATIKQKDPQRVVYDDTHLVISPYAVDTQTTKVKLPNKNVESFTKNEPSKRSGSTLTFGPYTSTPPFSLSPMHLHFENNSPFAVATRLEREIEVSHWGNIYVQEEYAIKHVGAKLQGSWSRLKFQSNPQQGGPSFREMLIELPKDAHSLYFRDDIGNVSTSGARFQKEKVEVALLPRTPLFGGWSTTFTFGYSLPLTGFLGRSQDGRMHLRMKLLSPINFLVIDELVVKVVLPEGATQITTDLPFDDIEQSSDVKYTYLDTAGRPVVVLRKRNVVQDHQVPFEVSYTFPKGAMLREPLLLISAFALFFATIILYSRCEFRITRTMQRLTSRKTK